MVIHSGGILLLLAYLVTLATVIGLLISLAILVARQFRLAAKVAGSCGAAFGLFFLIATIVPMAAPQTVIKVGDSYCWDLWCMGIEKVNATPRGQDVVYKLDVHFFSDANTVKTGIDDALIFLVDERGRRFPLLDDSTVPPINSKLDPGQSIKTTLTFVTPADAGQLFLTGDAPLPEHVPLGWRIFKIYADLHFGYEKLAHKPTVLRVV